jgi:hypothetical protein
MTADVAAAAAPLPPLRVAVLDIETRPSAAAHGRVREGGGSSDGRLALQEVAAAAILTFEASERGLADVGMWSGADEEGVLLAGASAVLHRVWGEGGRLVSHNGKAWDLPVCRIRAAASGLFVPDPFGRWAERPDLHDDTLAAWGGGRRRGPALADLCAAFGFSGELVRSVRSPSDRRVAKAQLDVVATAIAWFHLRAPLQGGLPWLAVCWRDLGRALLAPPLRAPHLLPPARRGLEVADALGV